MQEMQEMQVWSLGQEYPLEKEMAKHSSILAWKTPRTEEPNGLPFMELQRVGPDLVTKQPQRQWLYMHRIFLAGNKKKKQLVVVVSGENWVVGK